jgi:hypothetical protein
MSKGVGGLRMSVGTSVRNPVRVPGGVSRNRRWGFPITQAAREADFCIVPSVELAQKLRVENSIKLPKARGQDVGRKTKGRGSVGPIQSPATSQLAVNQFRDLEPSKKFSPLHSAGSTDSRRRMC